MIVKCFMFVFTFNSITVIAYLRSEYNLISVHFNCVLFDTKNPVYKYIYIIYYFQVSIKVKFSVIVFNFNSCYILVEC